MGMVMQHGLALMLVPADASGPAVLDCWLGERAGALMRADAAAPQVNVH
jgi:hypothetical protein